MNHVYLLNADGNKIYKTENPHVRHADYLAGLNMFKLKASFHFPGTSDGRNNYTDSVANRE